MALARPSTSRNVVIFGITSFLNDTASEMAYWILPAFLITLGAGPAQLGLIEGIAESVAASAKLFSGYLADRFPRRKPLVVAGYAIANIAKPILAITTSWWQVLVVRFFDRTAKGIRGAPRDVMVAESVDSKSYGSAFGLLQSMDSAGAIAGPLIALLILSRFSVRTVFWVAAVPGFLSIAVVSIFARETKKKEHDPKLSGATPAALEPNLASAKEPPPIPRSFYFVLLAVGLFSLGNSSDTFLILRAQEVHIDIRFAPLLGLVFNTVYTLASWPAGKFSDRVPKNQVAAAGYLVFAFTYAVFAKAPSHSALWVSMALYGFYYALTNPVLRALVVESVAPESRGRALGIFYFVTSILALLSSVVTGQLWNRFGAPVPLYLSAALAAIAALMLAVYRPAAAAKPSF